MSNIITDTIQKLALQESVAQGQVAGYQMSDAVSDDAKLIASAIQQAGAQIAQAVLHTRS